MPTSGICLRYLTTCCMAWRSSNVGFAKRCCKRNASNVLDDDSFDQYQSVVGMLNWLAVKTRPDIRFASGICLRYLTTCCMAWRSSNVGFAKRCCKRVTAKVLDDDSFDQYQSVVGMLNWLAVKTRPDIRFAVTRRIESKFWRTTKCNANVRHMSQVLDDVLHGVKVFKWPDIRFAVTRLQHRLANPTFEDLHAMQHVVKYLSDWYWSNESSSSTLDALAGDSLHAAGNGVSFHPEPAWFEGPRRTKAVSELCTTQRLWQLHDHYVSGSLYSLRHSDRAIVIVSV
jgi:hypothetical protein